MCNKTCIDFGKTYLSEAEIRGKDIIEIGSLDVNGSLRPAVVALEPASYTGVDLAWGIGVDRICRVEDLISTFGAERFDVVISTELLEHVRDWRGAIHNMKTILKEGGVMILTTRSLGAEYHGFPHDFWRFELSDIRTMFVDFQIDVLLPDDLSPGILMKARKISSPKSAEADLKDVAVYSILAKKRMTGNPWVRIVTVYLFGYLKPVASVVLPGFIKKGIRGIVNQISKNR